MTPFAIALTDFVARWYAQPLTAEDGNTPAEIAEATPDIRGKLPAVLTTWFGMVGRRLAMMHLLKLDEICPYGVKKAVAVFNNYDLQVHVPLTGDDSRSFQCVSTRMKSGSIFRETGTGTAK